MDIKLDANGDIDLSTGDLQLTEGSEATAQRVKRTWLTFKGEWFADDRIGMTWKQDVFTKPARLDIIQTRLRQIALTVPGVDAVVDLVLSFTGPTRNLAINATIRETSGELITFDSLPII